MVINYVPGEECRVAMLEDGRLEEFHTERAGSVSFVGNIYVGRVTNVEPSIQAAFVDFGLESNGFLHVSDVHPMYFPGNDDKTEQIGRKTPRRERPPIQACLKRGQEIVVQVLKEGINTKGPTLTSYISIPGRYLVMLPDMDRVGVSRKVEDEELRREMRKALDTLSLPEGFGFILRTAGEGKGKAELKRDLAYLQRLWKDIERRRKSGNKPRLLYAESDLLMRVLRDLWTTEVGEIVIDDESALRRAGRFMKIVSPRSATKLLKYDRPTPIFHAFAIEEQISRIYAREVPLPSGGSLVIDETEAMIAIDVNSGKMRHHGDAETTAYKTNVEAVDEICRQLRLRDVGGLVLCDLIDMMSRSHRRDIENRFKDRLKRDRSATKTLPISQFGIVEMTRQRQKQSLRNTHYAKCPSCTGRGMLKRPDSVADDAMRELAALLEHERVHKVELVVSPRVAGELLSHKRKTLGRLELTTRKHADVRVSEDIPVDRVSFYAYDENGADIDLERLPRPKPPTSLGEWDEKPTAAEEWAVDILQEESTMPADALVGSESDDETLPGDDLILADTVDESDNEDESAEPLSPDLRSVEAVIDNQDQSGRKRRRRRRRRGRGGTGEGAADQPAQPREQRAGAEGPEPGETEEGGGRKRRRRRRRRGRAGADDTPAWAVAEQNGDADALPDDPAPPRGDSWDLPASAVRPAPVPESDAEADEPEAEEPEALEAAPAEEAPAPKKKRSRRGKRSGKKVKAGAEPADTPEPADDDEQPEPASDSSDDAPAETKRRRGRRGGRKRKGADDGASKPPKAEKPAPKPAEPAPAKAKEKEPGAKSKPRVLYGAIRKLKPSEAARVRSSGGDE